MPHLANMPLMSISVVVLFLLPLFWPSNVSSTSNSQKRSKTRTSDLSGLEHVAINHSVGDLNSLWMCQEYQKNYVKPELQCFLDYIVIHFPP